MSAIFVHFHHRLFITFLCLRIEQTLNKSIMRMCLCVVMFKCNVQRHRKCTNMKSEVRMSIRRHSIGTIIAIKSKSIWIAVCVRLRSHTHLQTKLICLYSIIPLNHYHFSIEKFRAFAFEIGICSRFSSNIYIALKFSYATSFWFLFFSAK